MSIRISICVMLGIAFSVFSADGENLNPNKIHLSAEEEAWIESHKTVKVGMPPEFPPLRIYTKGGIEGFMIG